MLAKPYMQHVVQSDSKRKLIMWPRGAGKTSYIVHSAIREMLLGKRVLVITPDKLFSERIFNSIVEQLESNILLSSYSGLVKRIVKFPYFQIRTHLDSQIIFASSDYSLCGQSADIIYVDEGCSIKKDVYTGCILPILQTEEHTAIEVLFTPNAVREKDIEYGFYQGDRFLRILWEEDPQWEHFHTTYRYMDNSSKIEEYQSTMSWPEFRAQFLAEWVTIE